ncbi:patatin-like phospholipase family protein, partial [Stenotrophomonas geniculata]
AARCAARAAMPDADRAAARAPAPVAAPKCEEASRLGKLMGRKDKC